MNTRNTINSIITTILREETYEEISTTEYAIFSKSANTLVKLIDSDLCTAERESFECKSVSFDTVLTIPYKGKTIKIHAMSAETFRVYRQELRKRLNRECSAVSAILRDETKEIVSADEIIIFSMTAGEILKSIKNTTDWSLAPSSIEMQARGFDTVFSIQYEGSTIKIYASI